MERYEEQSEKRQHGQSILKEKKYFTQKPAYPPWEVELMISDYQKSVTIEEHIPSDSAESQICVCVRKRPQNRKELLNKELDIVWIPQKETLILHEPRTKVDLTKFVEHQKYRFDYAFDQTCDNAVVYKYTAKPLVQTLFDGGMATCFAYGQTGSGKTHTMSGEFVGKIPNFKTGIYAMAAEDIFLIMNLPENRGKGLVLTASFFEIYGGKIFDLLADRTKLRLLEDGQQQVQLIGLLEVIVNNVDEVINLLMQGNELRRSGQTSVNENSSRSHAVFELRLRKPETTELVGKFSFVDLAGNERGADNSPFERKMRLESAEINKSLLALKECIRAIGKQSTYLPFRVSLLTKVLRESFIGEKSRTCMIATISPGLKSCEHTLNTLRYANRVKELVVKDVSHALSPPISKNSSIMVRKLLTKQKSEPNLQRHRAVNASKLVGGEYESILELKLTETDVIYNHRAFNEYLVTFLWESERLINMTKNEYDHQTYAREARYIFTHLHQMGTNFIAMLTELLKKLMLDQRSVCDVHDYGAMVNNRSKRTTHNAHRID